MKKNNDYRFYVYVDETGKSTPLFEFLFEPNIKFNHLINQLELSSSQKIREVIANIDNVINGNLEVYYIGVEDALDINIFKNKIIAEDLIQLFGYDKEDKTEHSTLEFLDFLNEWEIFLEKYENNEIPNLNNPKSKKTK